MHVSKFYILQVTPVDMQIVPKFFIHGQIFKNISRHIPKVLFASLVSDVSLPTHTLSYAFLYRFFSDVEYKCKECSEEFTSSSDVSEFRCHTHLTVCATSSKVVHSL